MYFLPCVCWLVVLCASHTTCTLLLVILRLVLFFFFECLALALQQMPPSWCYYKIHHASCALTVLKTHIIDAVLKC